MGGLIKKFLKDEKGASELVETIVALQIVLMLAFGMIYFISAAREDVIMESAARTGAREYGITGSKNDAIAKTHEELKRGRVSANIFFSGDAIVVTKTRKFRVPFARTYTLAMQKKSQFHEEADSWYYDKEPGEQRGPKSSYSGYTGNPYK